jgi:hypothetical protein
MFEKISKVIDERYLDGDYISIRDKNGIHISDAIEEILAKDESITEYNVDYDETYNNPGCTIYYVSIAYIENGELGHFTYIAEEC